MARPPKWETPEELQEWIDRYFHNTPMDEYTISGLCLYLDTNKQTLLNYQEKPEFKHIIDMAKLRVENAYELSLRKHGRSGDIFALKNFGWTDQRQIEMTGKDGGPVELSIKAAKDKLIEKLNQLNGNNTGTPDPQPPGSQSTTD